MSKSQKSNSKAVSAGIGYTIGNYMLKGLSFFTIPLFTRLLSTSDYGTLNTVLAYEGIICIIMSFTIHSSYKNARYKYKYVSEGAKPGEDYYTYISTTLLLVICSFLGWLVVCNIIAPIIESKLGIDKFGLNLVLIYSFSSAIITCYNIYLGIRYEYKQFVKVSGINAVSSICISVLLILTIFRYDRYIGRLLGITLPSFLIALYIVIYFFRKAKPGNKNHSLSWGLKYSIPIVPHGLGQVVLNQFDRIMITSMVGSSFSGIYSFGYNIYSIVIITAQSLDNVWNPWFYEQMQAANTLQIKKKSSIYVRIMTLFTCAIICVSPEIVKILGAREYWDAVYCVVPIMAGGFFTFLYTLPVAVEYYYEKTTLIAAGTIGAALINIALNYIFIGKFGYIAAAYTTLATYIIYFIFHYCIASHIEKESLFSLKNIIICSAGVLAIAAFSVFQVDTLWIRWLVGIICGVSMIVYGEKTVGIIQRVANKFKGSAK